MYRLYNIEWKINVNGEFVMLWKETFLAYFKELSQNLPGGTEENREKKYQSGLPTCESKDVAHQPVTFRSSPLNPSPWNFLVDFYIRCQNYITTYRKAW
jgi:hypothetical protein